MSGGMVTTNVSGKADVVLSTKGDIVTYDTARIRKAIGNNSATLFSDSSEASGNKWDYPTTSFVVACSSESDDLETGDDKVQFRMPFQFELTDIIANVNVNPTGADLHVMVQEDGSDIMSGNGIEIDAGETTSESATTQPTITDSTLAFNSIISVDLDQVGSTLTGSGLKINFIGYRIV
tara:strand:+ start:524 stop:1060 length:537 start_codon:yes stop_codon:yes gene_type:complete